MDVWSWGVKIAKKTWSYSWIACELQVGTSLRRRHNLVRFQIWDHFWIPQPKLHGECYLIFFVKPQNGIVWSVSVFRLEKSAFHGGFDLSFEPCLSSTRCESNMREELTRTRITSVNLVIWILLSKKYGHVLNYRWYTRARYHRAHARYHRAHADQLDFLN